MRIEDLKRTHWIVIALGSGLLLSYLQANVGEDGTYRTIERQRFVMEVLGPPVGGYPRVRNIVVYPPRMTGLKVIGPSGQEQIKWIAPVRFDWLQPTDDPKVWRYQQWGYNSDATATRDGPPPVRAHLAELSKQNRTISYHYAWWREPRWVYILWTGGAVLIIGVIWPTIQNVLVGAGYGKQTDPSLRKVRGSRGGDTWRWYWPFAGREKLATTVAGGRSGAGKSAGGSTAAADAELAERMKSMEQGLSGFLQPGAAATQTGAAPGAPTLAKLQSGPPAEELAANSPAEKPKAQKEYGGEFYPTVAHAPIHKPDKPA